MEPVLPALDQHTNQLISEDTEEVRIREYRHRVRYGTVRASAEGGDVFQEEAQGVCQ